MSTMKSKISKIAFRFPAKIFAVDDTLASPSGEKMVASNVFFRNTF